MITQHANRRGSAFLEEVIEATPGGERIVHCLQCGTCGGSCPNGADMQFTPRAMIAMINGDRREDALTANTMWFCVSCYACTSRCPQNIPITDIMYTLKRLAIAGEKYKGTDAPKLAKTFTDMVERFGRSYEAGLATMYYLLNRPVALMKMMPMGASIFFKGRMAIRPTKIKNVEQLQAIIKKAREIGGKS
jgi:heterodisulfide reductase subunit C